MPRATRVSWLTIVVAICSAVSQDRNVNAFTTRSYDLDVPGSRPIRIIEADPGWNLNTRKPASAFNRNEKDKNERDRHDRLPQSLDSLKSNYKPFTHRGDKDDRFRPDFEHRTLKPDVISDRNDRFPSGSSEEVDNSDKLKKFLNSYAQNVHKQIQGQINKPNLSDNDDELNLDNKFVDISTDSNDNGENKKPEKSKSWNLLHFDKIQDAQDNKKWVSMEAVPWSVSKISKWHGKPKKDKYQNQHNGYYNQNDNVRPYNDRFHAHSQAEFPRPTYKPIRPNGILVGQRPHGYFDNPVEEGDIEDPLDDDYYNKRPSFSRPSATYGHKVNLHTAHSSGSQGNVNKRPFKDNCNNNYHNHHNVGSGFQDHVHDDSIITDGLPSNFPEHDYGNRRRGVSADSAASASASHPFSGEVLPPLDDGRVNMTTSHGGLLQVDGTFQSVEDAQKQHAKRQKLKVRAQRRPLKVKPQLDPLDSTIRYTTKPQTLKQKVQYQIHNGDSVVAASAPTSSVSDPSAVLAAVGAGMIPAGMALLVPMAMSGKRRRRQVQYPKYVPVGPYTNAVTVGHVTKS